MPLELQPPETQMDFVQRFLVARNQHLVPALSAVIQQISVPELDRQLAEIAPTESLSLLASRGVRGERVFATEIVLRANPRLLAYYRLLLGYSQKEFYQSQTGLNAFKRMEEKGEITLRAAAQLGELCRLIASRADQLLASVPIDHVANELLHELTILTLGPQLRGGKNVRRGTAAIVEVYSMIRSVVTEHVISESKRELFLLNSAGRRVRIGLASDPDIVIQEERSDGKWQRCVAIEVKGGQDFSNIHNRVGEAEKSHQKAKESGYVECWTVLNVDSADLALARRESPSTDEFFLISALRDSSSHAFNDFQIRLRHLTAIPDAKPLRKKSVRKSNRKDK
jgi:hypothetical protein